MNTTDVHASTIDEGDDILVDGTRKQVESTSDNEQMNGVWFNCTDGHSCFYHNGDTVQLILD